MEPATAMAAVSASATFLGFVKSVLNFEPEQKAGSRAFDRITKNMSDEEKKTFNMAKRLVLNKPRTTSITKQLEKSIAHYPLIVSDGISSEVAIDLSKINESRIAEYIKIILQTDKSALDIDEFKDIGNFMNQFKGTSVFRAADVDELIKEGCEKKDVYEILESIIKDETIGEILQEAKDKNKAKKNKKFTLPVDKDKPEEGENRKVVTDRDLKVVKGANQTVPTVVEAEITFMKGDSQATKKVYLAIKSMLHVVPGTDMMNAIAGKIAKGGFLTKVIKWYTGEISFIRDIFLNLDEIKSVEGTSTNKGQYIVDKLFDFTKRGSVNAILDETGEGKFIPTTTLAISIDDVMYLKSISGINLLEEMQARRIMKDMGLLAIMVVDELKDILYTFDDGLKTSYEVYSLSGKTKEDKTNSKLMTAFFGNKKV